MGFNFLGLSNKYSVDVTPTRRGRKVTNRDRFFRSLFSRHGRVSPDPSEYKQDVCVPPKPVAFTAGSRSSPVHVGSKLTRSVSPEPVTFMDGGRSSPVHVRSRFARSVSPEPVAFMDGERSSPVHVRSRFARGVSPEPVAFMDGGRSSPAPIEFITSGFLSPVPIGSRRDNRVSTASDEPKKTKRFFSPLFNLIPNRLTGTPIIPIEVNDDDMGEKDADHANKFVAFGA